MAGNPRCTCERVLIVMFLFVYVLTMYDKGTHIRSPVLDQNNQEGGVMEEGLRTAISKLPHSVSSKRPTSVTSDSFERRGHRLECLNLVASQVDRLDRMTLVRMPRRKATAYLASEALQVEGDFVEAGVFRGGTAIIMNGILACNNATDRTLWLADSFAGLPKPEWHEGDQGGKQEAWDGLSKKWTASQDELRKNFAKFGVWYEELPGVIKGRLGSWSSSRIGILAGWFKDTLPTAPIKKVSFLRCDADMYSSTLECLSTMYPKLSVGGFVYIDDYHEFAACKRAVMEYRESVNSIEPLYTIVEDGDYHFVENMSDEAVKAHRESHARGTPERHIDAVFWKKEA